MRITRIWIEPGCIQCAWCNDLAPEVFAIGAESSAVRGDARIDGVTDANPGHVALRVGVDGERGDFMEFLAAGCPPQVIKLADGG